MKTLPCTRQNLFCAIDKIGDIFGNNHDFYYSLGYLFKYSPSYLYQIEKSEKSNHLYPVKWLLHDINSKFTLKFRFIQILEDFLYMYNHENVYDYFVEKYGLNMVLNSAEWMSKENVLHGESYLNN